jgi:site-specific DNA-methyltransferase (adenine-specific)
MLEAPAQQTSGKSPILSWNRSPAAPESLARLSAKPPSDVTLIRGDNLTALHCLQVEHRQEVTLAYLDPPFLTGRQHHRVTRGRDEHGQLSRATQVAFDDRWCSLAEYLDVLGPRVEIIRSLLAPHGSVVLHVDPKTSHYAKVLCDEIFGPDSFASEVIWRYRRWPSKTKNFQRVHDVMLRYVKDPQQVPRFNQLYEPLAPSTQRTWGDRKQRAVVGDDGRRVRSSSTKEKSLGTPLGDVWEIGIVAPVAKERTGYPTQKPEALLRRWIESCSDQGDLILDPYMGSGTTLVVAAQLGRRCIGIDAGADAHEITERRLTERGVQHGRRQLLSPVKKAKPRAQAMSTDQSLHQTGAR